MSYYAKRFDLKTEITTIEGTYNTLEEAQERCIQLCEEENKLDYTTCVFSVEDTIEDAESYDFIIRSIFEEICEEYNIPKQDLTDEYIANFKKLI